jgi:hypothetical protein
MGKLSSYEINRPRHLRQHSSDGPRNHRILPIHEGSDFDGAHCIEVGRGAIPLLRLQLCQLQSIPPVMEISCLSWREEIAFCAGQQLP